VNPSLRMIITLQRVADLPRSANAARRVERPEDRLLRRLGRSYKLPGGPWIYRRHDSS
jgi:hypothetical protein